MALLQPSSAIENLFALPVAAAELIGPGDPAVLIDREVERAESMGEHRKREFSAGRACARLAMDQLGADGPVAVVTDGRAPRWPDGLVGSITHTRGYCAAVVARTADVGAAQVGLDVEVIGRVKPNLWRRVFVEAEREQLARRDDADLAATVTFSVKEALYKAQFPVTQAWVGFEDVRVDWGDDGELVLCRETSLPALDLLSWPVRGRWLEADGRVITAVTTQPA